MGFGGIWRALRAQHDEAAERTWAQHQRDQAELDAKRAARDATLWQKIADTRERMRPRPITPERLDNLRQLQEPYRPAPGRMPKPEVGFCVGPSARTLLLLDMAKKVQEADERVAGTPQPPN